MIRRPPRSPLFPYTPLSRSLSLVSPAKPDMLALDLPLVKRDGAVTQLAGADAGAHLGLPRVAAELYRSARRLRVFVIGTAAVPAEGVRDLVMTPPGGGVRRVEPGRPVTAALEGS